jgi:hypothetical protein
MCSSGVGPSDISASFFRRHILSLPGPTAPTRGRRIISKVSSFGAATSKPCRPHQETSSSIDRDAEQPGTSSSGSGRAVSSMIRPFASQRSVSICQAKLAKPLPWYVSYTPIETSSITPEFCRTPGGRITPGSVGCAAN